jgi:EF-hand
MIAAAASQCFDVAGEDKEGERLLSEADLMKWLLREPQIVVWLPTFYRLLSAKGVRHGIRCANCKIKDITGMR